MNVEKLFLALLAVLLAGAPCTPLQAQEAQHDYRSTIIESHNGYSTVLVIDGKTGDMWRVWQAPQTGAAPAMNGVTYLSKLKVGTSDGEVISRQGGGLPPVVSR